MPRPQNKYYYPGFTLGGPVVIPGRGSTRASNKLFFFTGYQYFYQVLDTGLLRATVPTEGMCTGNFSPAELAKMGTITASGSAPGQINARNRVALPGRNHPGIGDRQEHAGADEVSTRSRTPIPTRTAATTGPTT